MKIVFKCKDDWLCYTIVAKGTLDVVNMLSELCNKLQIWINKFKNGNSWLNYF